MGACGVCPRGVRPPRKDGDFGTLTNKGDDKMDSNIESPDTVLGNMTDEELAQLAQDREDAEKAGVFDDHLYDCIESPDSQLHLTVEQEMVLHHAASSLSDLARETNSSVSELLKFNGYSIC